MDSTVDPAVLEPLEPAQHQRAYPAPRMRAAAAVLALSVLALPLVAIPADAGAGVLVPALIGVALPVGFGLYRLGRDRADRFALLLVVGGSVYSITTLAESHDSTLYSVGRL